MTAKRLLQQTDVRTLSFTASSTIVQTGIAAKLLQETPEKAHAGMKADKQQQAEADPDRTQTPGNFQHWKATILLNNACPWQIGRNGKDQKLTPQCKGANGTSCWYVPQV